MSVKKSKCLTLIEKSLVIQELTGGQSVTYLSKKYGVAKSTVCKIKQNKEMIWDAVRNTYFGPGKRQTLKRSDFPRMERKLYEWFLDQCNQNVVVSGEKIKQKAKFIHSQISENDKQFSASEGWLQRFKTRFGIRFSKSSGEKLLLSQPELVGGFKNHDAFEGPDALKSIRFEDVEVIETLEQNNPEPLNKISGDSAENALNVAIQWAEESDVDISDLKILKRLGKKAISTTATPKPKKLATPDRPDFVNIQMLQHEANEETTAEESDIKIEMDEMDIEEAALESITKEESDKDEMNGEATPSTSSHIEEPAQESSSSTATTSTAPRHPLQIFFDSMAHTAMSFPAPLAIRAKMEVLEVISKLELEMWNLSE